MYILSIKTYILATSSVSFMFFLEVGHLYRCIHVHLDLPRCPPTPNHVTACMKVDLPDFQIKGRQTLSIGRNTLTGCQINHRIVI